jgi:hypothetical protein
MKDSRWTGHISHRKCLLKHVTEKKDIKDEKMRKKK